MDNNAIKRRSVLASIAGASATALSGCLGDSGSPEGLGERVPEVVFSYFADTPATPVHERALGPWEDMFADLGIDMSPQPMALSETINSLMGDQREVHIAQFGAAATSRRLDPNNFMERPSADNAGLAGDANWYQYVNCEFTHLAKQQGRVMDEDERRQMVNEAVEVFTEDATAITQMNTPGYGGYNTRIDLDGVGDFNVLYHHWPARRSEVLEGDDTIVVTEGAGALEKINNPTSTGIAIRAYLIGTSLFQPSPEGEFEPGIATDYEVSGTEVTVSLRDDAVFHNGDPVTAEDVAWTYWYLWDNPEYYFWQSQIPWDYDVDPDYGFVEVVDDYTVRFHLEEQYAPILIPFTQWGILHSDSWIEQGAEESPEDFEPDPFIGSGPFTVTDLRPNEIMRLEPHPHEHPISNPSHNLNIVTFDDATAAFQALQQEEIDILQDTSFSFVNQMEDIDHVEPYIQDSFDVMFAAPQQSFAPFKFKELRQAVSASLNREEINQLGFGGEATVETAGTRYLEGNPWRPPEEYLVRHTEDPTGEPEVGRQILEDAGWGWDSSDNLYYPEDADLDPVWPEGEMPSPDDFPCLDDDGNYVPN